VSARLRDLLASSEYLSYAYSYPHKTAYRALEPAASLADAWASEDRNALSLYLHVPFCEQRCGFCNLFTQALPKGGVEARYVAAVERQAAVMAEVIAPARFARLAIGGGTPTFLAAPLLERLFGVARALGASGIPTSIEVSPPTFDRDKLAVLVAHGVTRVSMGVQSIVEAETDRVHRHQSVADVELALEALAGAIPIRNVDLIYGLPGQTPETLRRSIDHVRALGANELYLYPLYVRPLTALGKSRHGWADARLQLYRVGRDHLLAQGWQQRSMRMFSAPGSPGEDGPLYRCQDDGMLGLGAGARSYTRTLHYASPFAVAQTAVRERIEAWIDQRDEDHAIARHGYWLDDDEQRRRFVLLSLLDAGLDRPAYARRFGADVLEHLPSLVEVIETELATLEDGILRLTERGIERADVIGQWLESSAVQGARAAWSGS
jgi:oxygen-independent coproporphyrinogen III oxidase